MVLLFATLVAGFLHLQHFASNVMTALCGILPALGASLEGINNQGEFRRVGKRSKSMANALEVLRSETIKFEKLLDSDINLKNSLFSMQIASLANESARLMISEALDWRVVFLDKPLNPAQ